MDFRLKSGALLLCLGLGAAGSAQAAEPGWYFVAFGGESSASGLSEGQSEANITRIVETAGLDVVSIDSNIDDSDTAFGIAGGYQLNDHFAFEFSYQDLGAFSNRAAVTITDGTVQTDADITLETKINGPAVSVLGIWPIGEHFSVFGRFGLSFMNADGTARISAEGQTQRLSQSSQKTDALYGIGLEYGIGKYWGVRLGWDRYLDVGTHDVSGSIDADVITLGVRLSGGWFR